MREARFYRTKVLPFLKENDFMSIKLSNTGSGHNVGLPDIFVAGHRMAFFIELKASESYETLPSSKKQGVYLGKLMAYGVPALFLCPEGFDDFKDVIISVVESKDVFDKNGHKLFVFCQKKYEKWLKKMKELDNVRFKKKTK